MVSSYNLLQVAIALTLFVLVSRPCRRCVGSGKTDTCQDIQHKKRGRPKSRGKATYASNEHNFKILYGTIESPAIALENPNIAPNSQSLVDRQTVNNRPLAISFVNEPAESFRAPSSLPDIVTSLSNPITDTLYQDFTTIPADVSFDYNPGHVNPNLLFDAVLPSAQLTTHPQFPVISNQEILFDYANTSLNDTTLSTSSNKDITCNIKPSDIIQQQRRQSDSTNVDGVYGQSLSIIMSMEVCCVKVSDETIKYWGYYPQELAHRSFYDFVSAKDLDRLARLHRLLLDNATSLVDGSIHSLAQTERTTSSLFSSVDHNELNKIANGSKSFSDSIHIKKRSGEFELYKVVVYIGGGLGADLYDATSHSKQYIVAQFRKHNYEVTSNQPSQSTTVLSSSLESPPHTSDPSFFKEQSLVTFSTLSPLSPTSPNSATIFGNFSPPPETLKPHSLLSSKEEKHRKLSTTSKFSQMSIKPRTLSPPKFHIAPITTPSLSQLKTSPNHSLLGRFPPSASSSVLTASSSIMSPSPARSASGPAITHPTQQYFLQTSSSTLNAAASAAQSRSRLSISGPTNNDNSSTSNRKMEMSIRSLLC